MGDVETIGRIAPSPSGYMHLGNAFSAALAWASARSRNGSFLLRLEDLDERCRNAEHAEQLVSDLSWLGLDWDGEPLVQSARLDAYEAALETIAASAELYPCFCTRADLHAASAPHASDGTPIYARTCYGLSEGERRSRSRERDGRAALRLHVPDEELGFVDGLQGEHAQDLARECGDFVVRRSDGVYAYQLVCVVDDIASGVTEVVRGSDLLSSTPRQLLLYRLLGAQAPRFAHHPLLLAPDGRRLSKRDADLSVASLRASGARPEDIMGRIAHLAGQVNSEQPMSADELVDVFDWAKVPHEDIVVTQAAFGK